MTAASAPEPKTALLVGNPVFVNAMKSAEKRLVERGYRVVSDAFLDKRIVDLVYVCNPNITLTTSEHFKAGTAANRGIPVEYESDPICKHESGWDEHCGVKYCNRCSATWAECGGHA